MELSPGHMEKLAELLRPPEPEILQGKDLVSSDIEITSTRDKVKDEEKRSYPRSIEEFEQQTQKEVEELSQSGCGLGGRKEPEYTMNYKQAVSAEDVYLQIGPKTPSSASCEHLIIRIKMPGDKMENIDLSVETTFVVVNSSQHHLKLQLPHSIDPDSSKANWDSAQETLILTLKLDREFDFVNF